MKIKIPLSRSKKMKFESITYLSRHMYLDFFLLNIIFDASEKFQKLFSQQAFSNFSRNFLQWRPNRDRRYFVVVLLPWLESWKECSSKLVANRVSKSHSLEGLCNGTALPAERFWWKTARWPASAIRSRKLSINVATIKAWARPTLEILPDHKTKLTNISQNALTHIF